VAELTGLLDLSGWPAEMRVSRTGAGLEPAIAVVADRTDPVVAAVRSGVGDDLGEEPCSLSSCVERRHRFEPCKGQLLHSAPRLAIGRLVLHRRSILPGRLSKRCLRKIGLADLLMC
jgi:hypothetical protein